MIITEQAIKELSLEVWEYLATHSEIASKRNLPEYLLDKIRAHEQWCPLCTLYWGKICSLHCPLAKANECCQYEESLYNKWRLSADDNTRKEMAQRILSIIKKWKVE